MKRNIYTLKNADKIIVICNGEVVETGTHNELITEDGAYANLYNSQFSIKNAQNN